MAINDISFYGPNIFAKGTLTESGTPDADRPVARLYDGAECLYWGQSGTGLAIDIEVDQSGLATPYGVDVAVLAHHNLDAATAAMLQYSDDGSTWTDLPGWTSPPAADRQSLALPATLTHAYWRLHITGADNPVAGELFAGPRLALDGHIEPDGLQWADAAGALWRQTAGGAERSLQLSGRRRRRNYALRLVYAQLSALLDFAGDYAAAFYFQDHKQTIFMARFDGHIRSRYVGGGEYLAEIALLEIIA